MNTNDDAPRADLDASATRGSPRSARRPERRARLWLFSWLLLGGVGCASAPPPEPASPALIREQRAEVARSLLDTGRALAAAGDSLRAEQYLRAALQGGAPPDDVLP